PPWALHSVPTRRSSDLGARREEALLVLLDSRTVPLVPIVQHTHPGHAVWTLLFEGQDLDARHAPQTDVESAVRQARLFLDEPGRSEEHTSELQSRFDLV